ncbi:unnamed protein product [Boreogadus saida]
MGPYDRANRAVVLAAAVLRHQDPVSHNLDLETCLERQAAEQHADSKVENGFNGSVVKSFRRAQKKPSPELNRLFFKQTWTSSRSSSPNSCQKSWPASLHSVARDPLTWSASWRWRFRTRLWTMPTGLLHFTDQTYYQVLASSLYSNLTKPIPGRSPHVLHADPDCPLQGANATAPTLRRPLSAPRPRSRSLLAKVREAGGGGGEQEGVTCATCTPGSVANADEIAFYRDTT